MAALHIKGEETGMAQGTVKWFNSEKGLRLHCNRGKRPGRVRPLQRNHGERVPQPRRGKRVEFDITQGQKGPQAENVRVID